MAGAAAPWEADAPAERRAPDRKGGAEPWRRDGSKTAEPQSQEALEREVLEEGVRIPGTDYRVPLHKSVNQFLVATGRGMIDLWAGGKQIALSVADKVAPRPAGASGEPPVSREAEYNRQQQDELQLFSRLENESPIISTVGRVAGQVAPTLLVPGMAAARGVQAVGRSTGLQTLTKAGIGTDAAAMGGLQGMINYVPEGQSRITNTAEGALIGGGLAKGIEYGARTVAPLLKRGAEKLGLAEISGTRAAVSTDDVAASLKAEGIDYSQIPQKVREALIDKANEAARAGAPLTPAEIARSLRAENLPGGPAKLTRGQMTGDRQQLRDEFNLRSTKAGQTLDEQLVAQDKVLADSIDVIKLRTGGQTAAGREAEAGEKITKPLLEQLKRKQEKVSRLYTAADEAEETLQKVDPTPLIRWVEDNFAAMHSAPAMKSLVADLKKSGLVNFSEDGVATAGREPTIREVESLRQAMVKWGKADGASGAYMGEAKRVLDGVTEGKGGELYAKARAARIELRNEFEDPGVINRLVSEKPGGDRVTAFEDVFKRTVLNGSRDDLVTLKQQLLQPIDKNVSATAKGAEELAQRVDVRDAGVQGLKDLRGATLDYLKLGALNNAKDEFSYSGFKKAVDGIGREKIEVLFGKNTANEIFSVLESAKDMKAPFNKTGIYNPGSASAFVDWIDRITGLIGLGKAGSYASGAAKKVWEGLHEGRRVADAAEPIAGAMRAGAEAKGDAFRELVGMYAGRGGAALAPGAAAHATKPKAEDE